MPETRKAPHRLLAILLPIYGIASLTHFVHNAQFLASYPNMPAWWSREGVYLAWLGMTAVGVYGWICLARGFSGTGLLLLVLYAALGLDSLGHYVLAPISAHTAAMNATILLEVTAAAVLLAEVLRLATLQLLRRGGRI